MVCPRNEQHLKRISRIGKAANCPEDILDKLIRFFYAMALFDLAQEKSIVSVSADYRISSGQLQSIQERLVKGFCLIFLGIQTQTKEVIFLISIAVVDLTLYKQIISQ